MSYLQTSIAELAKIHYKHKDYSELSIAEWMKLRSYIVFCDICHSTEHNTPDCHALDSPNYNSPCCQDDHYESSWEPQNSLHEDCSDYVSEPCFECIICGCLDHVFSDCPFFNPNLSLKESCELYSRWENHKSLTVNAELLETRVAQEACLFEFETEKIEIEKPPCDHDCFEIEPYVDFDVSHSDFDNCKFDLSDKLVEEKIEKIDFGDNGDIDLFDNISFMVKSDELENCDVHIPQFELGEKFEIDDKLFNSEINSFVDIDKSHCDFALDFDFDSFDDELFVGRHEGVDFEKSHFDLDDNFEIDKLFDDVHEELNKDLNNVKIDESHHVDIDSFDEFKNLCFIDESNERHKHYYDDPMLEFFDKSPIAIEDRNLKKGLVILLNDKHRKIIENIDFDSCIFLIATLIMIYMIFWIFGLVAKIFGQRKRKKLHAIYFGTDSPASP